MARMSSDLTEMKTTEPAPKGTYTANISEATPKRGKNEPHNPFIEVTFVLDGDENGGPSQFSGRRIPYNNIMAGGISTKDGVQKPLIPYQMAKLLEAFQIPHTCLACHPDAKAEGDAYDGRYDRVSTFYRCTGDDGVGYPKGQILCDDCKKPMEVCYDTKDFIGKRARVSVDVGQTLKGVPINEVKDYAKL